MEKTSEELIDEVLADPAVSYWLKNSLRSSLQRDPAGARTHGGCTTMKTIPLALLISALFGCGGGGSENGNPVVPANASPSQSSSSPSIISVAQAEPAPSDFEYTDFNPGARVVSSYKVTTLTCAAVTIFSSPPSGSFFGGDDPDLCMAYAVPLHNVVKGDLIEVVSDVQLSNRGNNYPVFVASQARYIQPGEAYGTAINNKDGHGVDLWPAPGEASTGVPYAIEPNNGYIIAPTDCQSGCSVVVWVWASSYGNDGKTVNLFQGEGILTVKQSR